MKGRLNDLRNKEVINISDGTRMGYVCDVGVDTDTANLTCLVIDGHPRLFGLLGRESDKVIPWADVKTVGDDTILVHYDAPKAEEKKSDWLSRFFREKP